MRILSQKWLWLVAAFAGGLLVGWLVIGWGVWPVAFSNTLPADLRPDERDEYLKMVAEELSASGNADAARAQLATWPLDQLVDDVSRLEKTLLVEDPVASDRLHTLSDTLSLSGDSLLAQALLTATPSEGTAETAASTAEPVLVAQATSEPDMEATTATVTATVTVTTPKVALIAPAAPTLTASATPVTTTVAPPASTVTPSATAAPTRSGPPPSLDRTDNYLVVGMDNRLWMQAWRTDSIMVVAIDHPTGQVGIVSIPRDLWIAIPGYGRERINAVDYIGEKSKYPGGGPALLRNVIQQSLGIPTQHYVGIKQDGLVQLVDALGGVTVTLDCPLYEKTPDDKSPTGYRQFTLPAGRVLLDGESAKKFATYRYMQSDFGRVRRQQQLIWALRNRALKGDVLPRIPELWTTLSGMVSTDLGLPDIVRLATLGMRLHGDDIHAMSLGPEVTVDYTTSEGAKVLLLRDRSTLNARLGQLFAARPIADVGKPQTSGCPAAPRGFPDLSYTVIKPAR